MSRPHYIIKTKLRGTKRSGRVGVGWKSKIEGAINITLDPGVALTQPEGVDITIYVNEDRYQQQDSGNRGGGFPSDDFGKDDIPF